LSDASAAADLSSEPALDGFYGALLDDDPIALYERAPCGYLSTLPDGTIVKVNETFLSLTGYAPQQLLGRRRFAELLTAGGRIYHDTHYAPMLQIQVSARAIALDLVRSDGARLPVLVNAVLERNDTGDPVVIRVAMLDATHRREYERDLLRAKERAEASERHATDLARTLQRTLMPPTAPTIPGLEVAGVYRPAGDGNEVRGDFYDIFQIGVCDWVMSSVTSRAKAPGAPWSPRCHDTPSAPPPSPSTVPPPSCRSTTPATRTGPGRRSPSAS
jgi:sigma-B regulation protein RsbU (phosphoserine phosphatase)